MSSRHVDLIHELRTLFENENLLYCFLYLNKEILIPSFTSYILADQFG